MRYNESSLLRKIMINIWNDLNSDIRFPSARRPHNLDAITWYEDFAG